MTATPTQEGLWGPSEPTTPTTSSAAAGRGESNDLELFASVVKAATDPGYVVVGASERVFLRDAARPGHVVPVPRYESDAVGQMLDAGHLKTGGTHHVTYGSTDGPARSLLVPAATRAMVNRWAALHHVPAPRRPPTTTPTQAAASTRPVLVHVDVVSPGKGLVTCGAGDFSGVVIRTGRSYDVETEAGTTIGTARTYKAGAERLARHHGHPHVEVRVEFERDPW